jgi:hypothetical protein
MNQKVKGVAITETTTFAYFSTCNLFYGGEHKQSVSLSEYERPIDMYLVFCVKV